MRKTIELSKSEITTIINTFEHIYDELQRDICKVRKNGIAYNQLNDLLNDVDNLLGRFENLQQD